jgi:hypothetical protein
MLVQAAPFLGFQAFMLDIIDHTYSEVKNWMLPANINPLKTDRSGRVDCCWPSPAESILVSGPVGIHDHISVLSKTFGRDPNI